jgi:hypothetical protein
VGVVLILPVRPGDVDAIVPDKGLVDERAVGRVVAVPVVLGANNPTTLRVAPAASEVICSKDDNADAGEMASCRA